MKTMKRCCSTLKMVLVFGIAAQLTSMVLGQIEPPVIKACFGEEIRFCNNGNPLPQCSSGGVCQADWSCSLPFQFDVVLPM